MMSFHEIYFNLIRYRGSAVFHDCSLISDTFIQMRSEESQSTYLKLYPYMFRVLTFLGVFIFISFIKTTSLR